MQAKKNSLIDQSYSLLDGTTGLVYLLFVGRDNYAQNMQKIMTDALFADKSNVNQVMHRLTQGGNRFLISKRLYREEGSRGRARHIYSANTNPIIITLKSLGVKFEESMLKDTLNLMSEASDFFPKFLTNIYQIKVIRKFVWHHILSMYFFFLGQQFDLLTSLHIPCQKTIRLA